MRTLGSFLVVLLAPAFSAACASTSSCSDCKEAQTVVESVQKQNPDCSRLTVHCADGGSAKVCASTDAARIGKPSDPEDLQAMQTGKPVVLDEAGALDVTVPIRQKDGKFQSACGVTLKSAGMTRDQLVAKANTIAKAVEDGLKSCCANCCK